MAVPIYMLGDDSPTPFVGAFRVELESSGFWFHGSGRIAMSAGVQESYFPARIIEMAIHEALTVAFRKQDRYDLIQEVWTTLKQLSVDQLGPQQGKDLMLAMTAGDREGVNVSGVGLSSLWGRIRMGGVLRWFPLVPKDHPLLGPAGIPHDVLGSLQLGKHPDCIVATPSHLPVELPQGQSLMRRLGVRQL